MIKYSITILTLLFWTVTAFADSVEVEYVERECIAGESLFFNVKISIDKETDAGKEIDISNIKYNGVPLKYEIREGGSQSFTVVINGRTIRQSSGFVKNYLFEIPTKKPGKLILPSFEMKVGDKTYHSKSLSFNVLSKPTSTDLLFKTVISKPQTVYYPTQIIEITNKMYFRNFPGSPAIQNISIPILKHKSFSYIPIQGADWEVSINQERLRIKPEQGTEVVNGKQYNRFAFSLKFRLMESGSFTFNNNIRMVVETGKLKQQMGFFGPQRVKEKKVLFADSPPLNIAVRDLPGENVPPSFNGAIGDFQIKVIPSSDTDVKVGDPITLSVEISGIGTWEFVRSPPIYRIPQVTDYFKVSHDPVAGEVSEDGTRKTFLVRMRVKSKTVKEIPPIPFTFFNLKDEKYVTIYSDPVPISVYDTARKASIVDYSQTDIDKQDPESQKQILSETTNNTIKQGEVGTIVAQRILDPIQISDNMDIRFLTDDHTPHYNKLIFACIPFLIVGILFGIQQFKNRDVSVEKTSQVKSKNAYKSFLKNIAHLEKKNYDPSVFYRDLGRGIEVFISERFLVNSEEITKRTFEDLIHSQKVIRENGDTLARIYDEIDYKRYTSAGFDPEMAKTVLVKAKKVLRKC